MNRGQSLFEVVVALAISALIIVTLVSLVSSAIRNSNFSKNKSLAARYAGEVSEWLRGERDSDIDGFFGQRAISGLTYCLPSLAPAVWPTAGECGAGVVIPGTLFFREVTFSGAVPTIQADISVEWTDSQGIHEVRNTTNFTDWRER